MPDEQEPFKLVTPQIIEKKFSSKDLGLCYKAFWSEIKKFKIRVWYWRCILVTRDPAHFDNWRLLEDHTFWFFT